MKFNNEVVLMSKTLEDGMISLNAPNTTSKLIRELREKYWRDHPPNYRTSSWLEVKESPFGKKTSVITIILSTRGCTWAIAPQGGCTMCGYVNDSYRERVTAEELKRQLLREHSRFNDANGDRIYKIYNSGSFFDNVEINEEAREFILKYLASQPNTKKIIVEARPEHMMREERLARAREHVPTHIELEVGLGLETSNDKIRKDCINKDFTFEDFTKAVKNAKKYDMQVKSYLMIKPPHLTEHEALQDAVKSAIDSARVGVSAVSLNAMNVQAATLVEYLWKQGKYRPPWLWTVLEIVMQSMDSISDTEIICEPVAGGLQRGAHNCGKCDAKVMREIEQVIKFQDSSVARIPSCSCRERWELIIEQEQLIPFSLNLQE